MTEPGEHLVGGKSASEVFAEPRLAALARSACQGDLAGISAALSAGADPNGAGLEGATPLMWAQHCESVEGMRALLNAGADPNVRIGIMTPVCIAAGMDNPAILRALLEHGGDPNAYFLEGSSALIVAFGIGMEERGWDNYWALLGAGASVNPLRDESSIAEFAAHMGQWDKVADLLERGYEHDLPALGLSLQNIDPEIMYPGQSEWVPRVRSMLEQRGVRFPLAPADAGGPQSG